MSYLHMVTGSSLFLSGFDFGQQILGRGVLKICSVKYTRCDFNKVVKQLFCPGFPSRTFLIYRAAG